MQQQKRRKYVEVSLAFAIVSIAATVFINIQIAMVYGKTDSKTRALGLIELFGFGYQYYVVVFGILSLMYAMLNFKIENQTNKTL